MEPERHPIPMQLTCPRIKNPLPSSAQLCFAPSNQRLICRPTGIKFNPLRLSAQRPSLVCLVAKPIPRSSVGSSSLLSTVRAMLSNSQGELADKLTRLRKELKQTMYLYKSACKDYQAMSATGKGELKDKLTKLLKELQQTMSDEDLYNSAGKELQAMSPVRLYNFARHSPTVKDMIEKEMSILEQAGALSLDGAEAYRKYYGLKGENEEATTSGANMNFDRLKLATELADAVRQREAVLLLVMYMQEEPASFEKFSELRKYGAGTSKGKEKMEGEGDQDEDMIGKEKRSILEPAGALSLDGAEAYHKYCGLKGENEEATTSGANMNFDRLRSATDLADVGRQREAVQEEPGSFEKFSELRKYEAGTRKGKERMEGEGDQDEEPRSLPKEELEDDELLYAIPTSEERECRPEVGTTGSASHVSYNINVFSIIANTSASLRLAWNNREMRGNDVEVRRSLGERERRPEVGTTGSASHVSYNINFFSIIANTSASARLARNNREMRGNDVEVSGSR